MRVASNTFSDRLVDTLGGLAARQMRYQTQAATGQRIVAPEDDPAAMRRVLNLQEESARVAQYDRNVSRLKEVATATHGVLRGLSRIATRAGEIATRADGTRSRQELDIFANEVTQLIQQAVNTANTTNRGDALLGGTRNDRPPYLIALGPDGRVLSVTYQGNAATAAMEIAEGESVAAHSVAANTAGAGESGVLSDPRSGADLFAHLIRLQDQLRAGDTAAIATATRPALEADEENLIRHLGLNSTVQARLEAAGALLNDRSTAIERQVSHEADADLAQTLVRLNETQVAYQAALQAGGKILSLSLLDYIR
jgi:flagellar hook-associated protein 3 FlgL